MYYRVLDTETNNYLTEVYNQDTKKGVKDAMKSYLECEVTGQEVDELVSLKWDQFVKRLKSMGFEVTESSIPYGAIEDPLIGDNYGDFTPDYDDFENEINIW